MMSRDSSDLKSFEPAINFFARLFTLSFVARPAHGHIAFFELVRECECFSQRLEVHKDALTVDHRRGAEIADSRGERLCVSCPTLRLRGEGCR